MAAICLSLNVSNVLVKQAPENKNTITDVFMYIFEEN